MKIADVSHDERSFTVTWDDRSSAEYPFVWLRDNDPDSFHPDAGERTFDLTTIDMGIRPELFSCKPDALIVNWPAADSPSVYGADWLHGHRPGRRRQDPALVGRISWDRESLPQIPRVPMADCESDPAALREALLVLKRTGLLILEGLDDAPDASLAFGDVVGFRRRTNFGDTFKVVSKPEPNNLAYTALALPLHTDLPNQELIPGYQVLHCYRNTTTGGESLFADGLRIYEDLRSDAPDDFELLRSTPIPWRFRDTHNDIRSRRPVIVERDSGELDYFVFNAAIADLPDMPAADLHAFYPAYQRLMQRIRRPNYALGHSLAPGEMVIFDNTRVLHGRTAFDAQSGERQLYGYYLERNEIDSRIRVLHREN